MDHNNDQDDIVDQSGNVVDQNVQGEESSALERAHASSHDLVN